MIEPWILPLFAGIALGALTMLFGFCAGYAASRRARDDRAFMIETLHELDRRACDVCPQPRRDPASEED